MAECREGGADMEVFYLTVSQMLMMFTLVAVGFWLRKKNILPSGTDVAVSKLETYAFVPALNLYNLLDQCTPESFVNHADLMLYGLLFFAVAAVASYPLSRLFVKPSEKRPDLAYQQNIYKYALTFANYGFMGNFIVRGIWGEEVFYQYTMFTFFAAFLCNAWGLYILIPQERNTRSVFSHLKKALRTPPLIALVLGVVLGLCNAKFHLPEFILSVLSNAADCMGPVAMLLVGIVIGGYDLRDLLGDKKIYILSLVRLLVIPSVFLLALDALGADELIVVFTLVAFATPLGMNTIVYPAAYGGDTKTGASMTMISTVFSVVTLPLMYLIFVELM